MDHSPLAHPLARHGATVRGLPALGVDTGFDEADEGLFRPRRAGRRRRAGEWSRLDAGGHPHPRPRLQSRRLCAAGGERPLPRRPRDGLVDDGGQPPDGDMAAYLGSLERVRARGSDVLWPTHGPPVTRWRPSCRPTVRTGCCARPGAGRAVGGEEPYPPDGRAPLRQCRSSPASRRRPLPVGPPDQAGARGARRLRRRAGLESDYRLVSPPPPSAVA
jgi:hypothetical protein